MSDEKLLESRWKYTDDRLNEYLKTFKKTNKTTQDNIQDILNSIDYSINDLSKIITTYQRQKLMRVFDKWEEEGLLTGYFKYQVETLRKKYLITNEEMLDILLYGAYVEERKTLDEFETSLFVDVANNMYNQGLKEIGKEEKDWSLVWEFVISLLAIPNIKGVKWDDYTNALSLTNSQEIKKLVVIYLQQEKKLDVSDDTFQKTFTKQLNRHLCINKKDDETKISGALDSEVRQVGNNALVKSGKDNGVLQVRFVSDLCKNVTRMCYHLHNHIFNVDDYNEFERYMGESSDDLVMTKVKVLGLVSGINLPPISHHFHSCHSTLSFDLGKSK